MIKSTQPLNKLSKSKMEHLFKQCTLLNNLPNIITSTLMDFCVYPQLDELKETYPDIYDVSYHEFGIGWYKPVEYILQHIVKQTQSNNNTIHITEKYGLLRVYLSATEDDDTLQNIIKEGVYMAANTCEECGYFSEEKITLEVSLTNCDGYIQTLCKDCFDVKANYDKYKDSKCIFKNTY